MPLTAALAGLASSQGIDYYHPPKTSNTPVDTLIWTVACVVVIAIFVAAAAIARSREDRRLATTEHATGDNGSGQGPAHEAHEAQQAPTP